MALQQIQGLGLMYPRIGLINIAPSYNASLLIDATGEKVALCGRVFIPARSGTKAISRVHIMFGAVTKSGGSALTISLQDVSLTAGPVIQPDGLADQSVAVPNADAAFTSNSWYRSGPLSSTRSVNNGELLAVVIEFDGAGRLATDSVIVNGMSLPSAAFILGQTPVSALFVASWAVGTNIPIVVLEFADGSFGSLHGSYPVSAINAHAYNSGTAVADEYALVINFPWQVTVDGLWACVAPSFNTSNYDLVLSLGFAPLATASIDANAMSNTGVRLMWVPIPETTLAANTDYYVSVKPTTANNVTVYSFDVTDANHWVTQDGGPAIQFATRLDSGSWSAKTPTRRLYAGVSISRLDDGTGTPVTFPPASKVYAGTDRGDGTIGTLHASNIATAAGSGSNLVAGDLRTGVTVDNVTGSLSPTGGGGGAAGSSDRINVGGGF